MFSLDLTATQTAAVIGISVRSVNAIFLRIRLDFSPGRRMHRKFCHAGRAQGLWKADALPRGKGSREELA
jgi:hypothetical protein